MKDSVFGFIGLGLIGGSIARGLKRYDDSVTVMAYMRTRADLEKAHDDGIVDIMLDGVDGDLSRCDMIFLCAPVENNESYLGEIKPLLKEGALVTDIGSTKTGIHEAAIKYGMEDVFIGGHPMAGSEKTGYRNSTDHLLENAYYVITPTSLSTEENIARVKDVALAIGAIPLILDYDTHDMSVAAVSHLPHIIAASLVNLVRDSDDKDEVMHRLAAGGFKDITRIASSSPVMWEQICMSNTSNIRTLLDRYIDSLKKISDSLAEHDGGAIYDLFDEAGTYRNTFANYQKGLEAPEYTFSIDVVDEPGAISVFSAILAARGINIKDMGLNYSRDENEGALRVSFYDSASRDMAWDLLESHNYTLYK